MIWDILRKLFRREKPAFPTDVPESEDTVMFGHETTQDPAVDDRLAATLYPELKRIARYRMRRERADHTLQPTALVNELYIHLLRQPDARWNDRQHFLMAASQAMHRLLVDHARARGTQKRGGSFCKLPVDEARDMAAHDEPLEVLAVDELLTRLADTEPRMAQVVKLRFFGGLTFAEIGRVLSITDRTAKRDWTLAKSWLQKEIGGGENDVSRGMGED